MAELGYSKDRGRIELLLPHGTKLASLAKIREELFGDWISRLPRGCQACTSGESLIIRERVGFKNSVMPSNLAICSGIASTNPRGAKTRSHVRSGRFAARSNSCTHKGRKVFRGVDSLTIPMMGWLRRRFARLRGSRSTAQVTPVPTPEPESTEAQPPSLSYRITVETAGGGEETHHYSRPGLPVTKDESIDLGGGRYVTVLEVVEEAQPGVKDGTIRAKLTPPPPPST
jgi:hypothetical protein